MDILPERVDRAGRESSGRTVLDDPWYSGCPAFPQTAYLSPTSRRSRRPPPQVVACFQSAGRFRLSVARLEPYESGPEPGGKRWYRVRYNRSRAANAVSPVSSGCSHHSIPAALSRNAWRVVSIFCDARFYHAGRGFPCKGAIGVNHSAASGIPWLSRLLLSAGLRLHDRSAAGLLHTKSKVGGIWRQTLEQLWRLPLPVMRSRGRF